MRKHEHRRQVAACVCNDVCMQRGVAAELESRGSSNSRRAYFWERLQVRPIDIAPLVGGGVDVSEGAAAGSAS